MQNTAKFIKTFIFYITSAFGASLAIKANVGVSSFNSMNVAISSAAQVKVGHITILINVAFLLIYMYLTGFSLKRKYLVQFATIFLFGAFINLFTYTLFTSLLANTYMMQILFISLGTIISGLSIGMIVHYDVITLPVEGCCLEFSKRSHHSFSRLRYFVDVFSILISILISYSFHLPLFVREGTLISMILLTASLTLMQRVNLRRINRQRIRTKII